MMAAVAAVALGFGYLRRPFPVSTAVIRLEATPFVSHFDIKTNWSDGRVEHIKAQVTESSGVLPRDLKASQPWPIGRGSLGPMLWVSWSDGATSYYLDGQLTVTQED
jgi:hypothetical protein